MSPWLIHFFNLHHYTAAAPVDVQCADLVDRLLDDGSFHVENPYFRNKTAYFLTGFESFELYKVLINSFLYTGKYLWIYGRKNMKLFSGNYSHFFRYLDEKTLESGWGMDGIDFRCLFLNPDSPEVSRAHKQQEIFRSELKACILRAKEVIGDNDALKKCFRLYSNKRDEMLVFQMILCCLFLEFRGLGRQQYHMSC